MYCADERTVTLLRRVLFSFLLYPQFALASSVNVEIVPIIVWNGSQIFEYHVESVAELRESLPIETRLVHMVSPVYLMRSRDKVLQFRSQLASILKNKDGVGMHLSPLSEWVSFAGTEWRPGRGLYGEISESCHSNCGIDQDLSGVSLESLRKMTDVAMTQFNDVGLGKPSMVYFEQGIVSDDIRSSVQNSGLKFDWSGFNLTLSKTLLEHHPVYISNMIFQDSLKGSIDSEDSHSKGLVLDHLRFGVVVDAVFDIDMKMFVDHVVKVAEKSSRSVRIPIIVNGASLVHSLPRVIALNQKIRDELESRQATVSQWEGKEGGTGWSLEELIPDKESPKEQAPLVAEIPGQQSIDDDRFVSDGDEQSIDEDGFEPHQKPAIAH
jgi:hypothetical protein